MFLQVFPRLRRLSLFPYSTLFRSDDHRLRVRDGVQLSGLAPLLEVQTQRSKQRDLIADPRRSVLAPAMLGGGFDARTDRKSTRLNSSYSQISYAVFCSKKKQQSFS